MQTRYNAQIVFQEILYIYIRTVNADDKTESDKAEYPACSNRCRHKLFSLYSFILSYDMGIRSEYAD